MPRYYRYSNLPMSIHDRIATPDGKRQYVRALFAAIADRYDLITVLLSFGRDRAWKRRLVRLAAIRPGLRVLDLATGTGDIAFEAARAGARVVGLDITPRMIVLARSKSSTVSPPPAFLVGDMQALPFGNASFDVVTTGYGLRNVSDLGVALDEIFRVLEPGGRAVALDFEKPANRLVRGAYLAYLSVVGGAIGWLLHRDPDTYRYIPASIRRYPGAAGVARLMGARGFNDVRHEPVFGGFMAIHQASKHP
jgi:demethylmenaquinone methyltransferase/2-methoxy-6-polyprenyl-1,4-benzoquinol methylase